MWSKRKRKSWDFKGHVYKIISDLSLKPLLDAGLISKTLFMIEVRRKIRIRDEQFWLTKIWNGNKLRLYRNFKKDLVPEHYVFNYMPRHLYM